MADKTTYLVIAPHTQEQPITKEILAASPNSDIDLVFEETLSSGISRIMAGGIGLVVLDLNLPDCHGLETFVRAFGKVPGVPIVVMVEASQRKIAMKAVRRGAQDCLIKEHIHDDLVSRLSFAVTRHAALAKLQEMAVIDELTGLFNRRGFIDAAERHRLIAAREKYELILLFADLDGMKEINDTLGHAEGDLALAETAAVFRRTFRGSDVCARIGGDEFVALIPDVSDVEKDALLSRLKENLAACNALKSNHFQLSLSIGTSKYDPAHSCSIELLLTRADVAMYEDKMRKKVARRRTPAANPNA